MNSLIEIIVKITGISKATKQLKALADEVQSVSGKFKRAGSGIDSANNALKNTEKNSKKVKNNLRGLKSRLHNVRAATNQFSVALKNFNRTMFAGTAIAAMFTNGLRGMFNLMNESADLSRIEDQFQNVFGEHSNISKTLSKFTDNFIDVPEAMKSALSLKQLGVVNDLDQASNIIAKAGTAAKMAGLDSGEGVRHFTKFLKDGAVSHLENLNLTRRTNEAFAAQMTILKARGGIIGGVIAQQHKLAFAQRLLNDLTKDSMFGNRDQKDILQELAQSWMFLKTEIGGLIFDALKPLINDYLIPALKWTTEWIKTNREANGSLVSITKGVLVFAGAIGTLVSALTALATAGGALGLLQGGLGILASFGGYTAGAGAGAMVAGLAAVGLFVVKMGLLVGAVGLLIYGIYELYNWLNSKDKGSQNTGYQAPSVKNTFPEMAKSMPGSDKNVIIAAPSVRVRGAGLQRVETGDTFNSKESINNYNTINEAQNKQTSAAMIGALTSTNDNSGQKMIYLQEKQVENLMQINQKISPPDELARQKEKSRLR